MYIPSIILALQLLLLSVPSSLALYAFEEVKIASSELASSATCETVSCTNLIAYSCAGSFKIFHTSKSTAVYSTTKAVVQVRASKLVADPFISFIEARTTEESQPAAYAYLRVVDTSGVRDLGISTTFLPNRSIYLGENLVLRINQALTNLQAYDVTTKQASTTHIDILNTELAFDYAPFNSLSRQWIIAACQKSAQSCNFYNLSGISIIPHAVNSVGEKCDKELQLTSDYLTLHCPSVNSVSLYVFNSAYVMSRIHFVTGVSNNDAKLMTFSPSLSVIFFTQSYSWSEGQTQPLKFIDSVVVLRTTTSSEASPIFIRFEKDLFYEAHAADPLSLDYFFHILGWHTSPNLAQSYGTIVQFSVSQGAQNQVTAITQANGYYSLHQATYCGLNAVRFQREGNAMSCYTPASGEFIDWVGMEDHGLVQAKKCSTASDSSSFSELQQILRGTACPTYSIPTTSTQYFTSRKMHLELNPVQCVSGKFAIGSHCVSCGSHCTDCSLPNTDGLVHGFYQSGRDIQGTCVSCDTHTILDNTQGKCECKDSYYLDAASGSEKCVPCLTNCAQCSNSDVCEKCELGYTVTSTGSCRVLACPVGTFLNQATDKCQNCDPSCESCSQDGFRCQTCPAGFNLGDTICLKCGFRETLIGDSCIKCGEACFECTSSATCTICQSDASLVAGKCTCKNGYYLDQASLTCQPCGPTCLTCEDNVLCKTCASGFSLGTSKCLQCQSNQFISDDECKNCGTNCLDCASAQQCNVCAANADLQTDGSCSCKAGYYFDAVTSTCLQCNTSCKTCSGPDKCDSCPAGQTLGATVCLNCASNQYADGDECKFCGQGCLECDFFGVRCLQCAVNSGLKGDGSCECLTGFYYSSQENACKSCNASCSTCSDAGNCDTCKPGDTLSSTTGLCECAQGTFSDATTGGICEACESSCATCTQKDRCLTCLADYELQAADNTCKKVVAPIIDSDSSPACASNQFESKKKVCKDCQANCVKCSSALACIECDETTSSLDELSGQCSCKDGFYTDGDGICTACDSDCLTCSTQGKCETCRIEAILGENRCLECPESSFIEKDSCIACPTGCKKCNDINTCTKCADGFESDADGLLCIEVTTATPLDENALVTKAIGFSIAFVIFILAIAIACFLCWRSYKKKQKWRKRQRDSRMTYEENSSVGGADSELISLRTKEGSQNSNYSQASYIVSKRGSQPQAILQDLDNLNMVQIKEYSEEHNCSSSSYNSRLASARESIIVQEHQYFEDSDKDIQFNNKHVFTPRLSQQTEVRSSQEQGRDLIASAMEIIGECEVDMSADAREKMERLALDVGEKDQSQVVEQIIRILALSVKEQVQIEQQQQRQPEEPESQLQLSRVSRSAIAQRGLSRLIGTHLDGARQSQQQPRPQDQSTIERVIAEHFTDEMSHVISSQQNLEDIELQHLQQEQLEESIVKSNSDSRSKFYSLEKSHQAQDNEQNFLICPPPIPLIDEIEKSARSILHKDQTFGDEEEKDAPHSPTSLPNSVVDHINDKLDELMNTYALAAPDELAQQELTQSTVEAPNDVIQYALRQQEQNQVFDAKYDVSQDDSCVVQETQANLVETKDVKILPYDTPSHHADRTGFIMNALNVKDLPKKEEKKAASARGTKVIMAQLKKEPKFVQKSEKWMKSGKKKAHYASQPSIIEESPISKERGMHAESDLKVHGVTSELQSQTKANPKALTQVKTKPQMKQKPSAQQIRASYQKKRNKSPTAESPDQLNMGSEYGPSRSLLSSQEYAEQYLFNQSPG